MIILERKDVDEKLWQKWCEETPELAPFCQLEYLDAVAENILFLLDEKRGGIALPYKVNFGVKTFYTPVFCRWVGFIGDQSLTIRDVGKMMHSTLPQADVYTKNQLTEEDSEVLIYQTLNDRMYALNKQAKRKIKKAEKENWQISWNRSENEAIDLIESSLQNKFKTLEDSSFPKLRKLAENFSKTNQLKVVSLIDLENKNVGSLLLLECSDKLLYVKGACTESAKLNGGMYLLMNEAIQMAFASGKNFDFGGSRIPGVRKFNLSFGAEDLHYYHLKWDKGPFWYSFLKRVRNKIKK